MITAKSIKLNFYIVFLSDLYHCNRFTKKQTSTKKPAQHHLHLQKCRALTIATASVFQKRRILFIHRRKFSARKQKSNLRAGNEKLKVELLPWEHWSTWTTWEWSQFHKSRTFNMFAPCYLTFLFRLKDIIAGLNPRRTISLRIHCLKTSIIVCHFRSRERIFASLFQKNVCLPQIILFLLKIFG